MQNNCDNPTTANPAGENQSATAAIDIARFEDICRKLSPELPTPCYVVDEDALIENLKILSDIQTRGNCRILLALKAFSMFSLLPTVRRYLSGVCASGVNEAALGDEFFHSELSAPGDGGKIAVGEVHAGAPAFSDADARVLVQLCDHLVFNSFSQLERHSPLIHAATAEGRHIGCSLRINPQCSLVETELYNPCSKNSRLGVRIEKFRQHPSWPQLPQLVDGLHFHALCEQGFDALEQTWRRVESDFAPLLQAASESGQLKTINLGGGHHITAASYDRDSLCKLTGEIASRYGAKVYLEPGEAVAINTGVLVASVLDIVDAPVPVAMLDASATAHMPDVLEMPYRPQVYAAAAPGEKPHTYRLAGPSCLAGDVTGDYSFDQPLAVGSRVILLDMAHYTMVKTTTFNGVNLPSIAVIKTGEDKPTVVKNFGYEDFKNRLS